MADNITTAAHLWTGPIQSEQLRWAKFSNTYCPYKKLAHSFPGSYIKTIVPAHKSQQKIK
jgi:hypothetical protein